MRSFLLTLIACLSILLSNSQQSKITILPGSVKYFTDELTVSSRSSAKTPWTAGRTVNDYSNIIVTDDTIWLCTRDTTKFVLIMSVPDSANTLTFLAEQGDAKTRVIINRIDDVPYFTFEYKTIKYCYRLKKAPIDKE